MTEKVKQEHLEGMEPPTVEEIEEAAEKYYGLNDKSWKMRGKVEEARDELLEVMNKHEMTTYSYDNKEITVTDKRVVKVKKKKPGGEDDE